MNQGHKKNLKLTVLDGNDGGTLTHSGDETEESSPPSQDPLGLGTKIGTGAGEEDVEMAERSSPGGFHTPSLQGQFIALHGCLPPCHTEPVSVSKIKKGTFTRTLSGAAPSSSRTTEKRKW